MTINPLSSTAASPTGATTSAGQAASSSNPLLNMSSGDTFLQLLVAQLKYQDPSNPTDPTQFLSQTAQMSEAANMSQLTQTMQSLLSDMGTVASTSMIGKQVTAHLADGSPVSGLVSSVGIESTGPVLDVGGVSVPLSSVVSVTEASSATSTGAAATSAAPTATSATSTGTTPPTTSSTTASGSPVTA